MWAEAEGCFEAQRQVLGAHGFALRARLEACEGLMSAYRGGVIRLALYDLATPGGALRATMLGALMGVDRAEVAWLFRALLPRLVAHEIGHALRGESGLYAADVRVEEQVADRMATLLARPMIDASDRARAAALLGDVTARLGGVGEAAALHRHAETALRRLGLEAHPEATRRARATLQDDYYRDVSAYLRVTAAWAWIDLTLDLEDDYDAFRRDHLTA